MYAEIWGDIVAAAMQDIPPNLLKSNLPKSRSSMAHISVIRSLEISNRSGICVISDGETAVHKIWGYLTLQWRHNERDGVWNRQPHGCIFSHLFKVQIKDNIKAPRHWPLCEEFTGNHLMTSSWTAPRFGGGFVCLVTTGIRWVLVS